MPEGGLERDLMEEEGLSQKGRAVQMEGRGEQSWGEADEKGTTFFFDMTETDRGGVPADSWKSEERS